MADHALKDKLKANRSNSKTGSGDKYWESVVRIVEEHYGVRPERPVESGKFCGKCGVKFEFFGQRTCLNGSGDYSHKVANTHEVIRMSWTLDLRAPEDAFKEELENILDEQFPKGRCKERGAALVLFAYANIFFKKHRT